jgi:hypothetical protein
MTCPFQTALNLPPAYRVSPGPVTSGLREPILSKWTIPAAKEWLQIGDKQSGPRLIAIMSVIKTEGRLPGLGVYHIGRRNNPVPVSNPVVITVIASVSIELVRNIIFNELLRIDRLAPISVD